MVRGHHKDIRIRRIRGLDRDHVGAGLPRVIRIGLRADLIPHLREAALQILRRRLLARRTDRAVLRGQGLQILRERPGIRQHRRALEDEHGFRHDNRVPGRQLLGRFAADHAGLVAPEHRVLRPSGDLRGIRIGLQLPAGDRRLARAAVQHRCKLLSRHQGIRREPAAAYALDTSGGCRPCGCRSIGFGYVGKRRTAGDRGTFCRFIQQLRRLPARDRGFRRLQQALAEGKLLRPTSRILRPLRPRRSRRRTGQERCAEQHANEFLLHVHRLIKQTVWFGFYAITNRPAGQLQYGHRKRFLLYCNQGGHTG